MLLQANKYIPHSLMFAAYVQRKLTLSTSKLDQSCTTEPKFCVRQQHQGKTLLYLWLFYLQEGRDKERILFWPQTMQRTNPDFL